MDRTRNRRNWIAGVAALIFIACGGSGSTGLILPETALFDEVRETGECRDGHGTTYCFAVAAETSGLPDPSAPCQGPCLGFDPLYLFGTTGLAPDAVCAVATRSDGALWTLEAPAPVGLDESSFAVFPPEAFDPAEGPLEAALLCFDDPPESLPSTAEMLADADPSIVFVAPLL
ncbi:MAG: hypothetical protein P8R42_17585 [Candidatus Binatia bacterium]|nr:hypothetical protein [Candidatus Binatia bacterium]